MILLFGNEFGINLEIESWVQIGTYFGIFFRPEEGKSIKSKIWKNKMIKRVPTKLQNDFLEWISLDMSEPTYKDVRMSKKSF